MVRRSSIPGAIEGCGILIQAQKIEPNILPFRTTQDIIVFPIKISRQGKGIIEREYTEKIPIIRDYSLLDQGDEILGIHLWGFSDFPVTKIKSGGNGRTGRHTGQNTCLNGNFCFLEIVTCWNRESISVHPKDALLFQT